MHEWLAQALQMQIRQFIELRDQLAEHIEWNKCSRTAWLPVFSELNRAHPAAQVALADWLNLNETGQLRRYIVDLHVSQFCSGPKITRWQYSAWREA
jgi:hypothetical protein